MEHFHPTLFYFFPGSAWRLFVPIGLIFFYLTLKSMLPGRFSLMASLFLGLNAIFLLHTRRAMAEGISFCLYFLILFLLFKYPRNAVVDRYLLWSSLSHQTNSIPDLVVTCGLLDN